MSKNPTYSSCDNSRQSRPEPNKRVIKIILEKRLPVDREEKDEKCDSNFYSDKIIKKLKKDSLFGRRCPFCEMFQVDFPGHLQKVHPKLAQTFKGLGKKL